jgi:hypothetical protein
MDRPKKTAASEKAGDVLMTTIVSKPKKSDEVSGEGRHESEVPGLLAGYLAKIGRGRLLTHQEEISLSRLA